MQDVYDFFYDVNELLSSKGLDRLDDMLRPANMSGMLSDMLTASLAKHSRTLTEIDTSTDNAADSALERQRCTKKALPGCATTGCIEPDSASNLLTGRQI